MPDAAEQLGVNYRRLLRMIKRGEVPHEMLPTGLAIFSDEQIAQIKQSWLREPVQNGTPDGARAAD